MPFHFAWPDKSVFELVSIWVYLPAFILVWMMAGTLLKKFVFRYLRKMAKNTKTRLDDLLLEALSFPFTLIIAVTAVLAALRFTPAGERWNTPPDVKVILLVAGVLAGIVFADRFLRGIIRLYSDRVSIFRTAGVLLQSCLRVFVLLIGILVLLDSLGVSVTPVLASLGVTSLAVALALQPTLENFFSGVQVVVDKQLEQGQFIMLETGEEGYVERIGWRSTWVRTLGNSMVVVPNKVLVTSRVLNHDYPTKECSVLVPVGVHYNMPLERVEQVTLAVAREIQAKTPGAIKEFQPLVRFHTFNNSSVDLNVILRATEFTSGYLLKHEFIKALHARYQKDKITIPFPIMAINLEQESTNLLCTQAAPRDLPAVTMEKHNAKEE